MQLGKLELYGFKSFAEKTEFAFEPGITAFVGPNGCGKSNVVDAVRWILGEQRARIVRGAEMADVIFNGTETRRSLGFAEASLTILNNRGILPVDFEEIKITRRIYRSGESEYMMNGKTCRLKDIRSLFTDTGVGMESYSIIEQGKVDRVLQANAQERRSLFEEAAGISGYKEQRRHTLTKLDRCKQNLLRVNDIIQEKERRLRSIKYQAAKARRHSEYTDRLRELSVSLARRNYEKLEIQLREAEEKIKSAEVDRNKILAEVEEIEGETAELQSVLQRHQQALNAAQQEVHNANSEIATGEERIKSGLLRAKELDESADNAGRNLGVYTERLSKAASESKSVETELAEFVESVKLQSERLRERSSESEEASRKTAELDKSIEEYKGRMVEQMQNVADMRNRIANLENQAQRDNTHKQRLSTRANDVEKEQSTLDENISRIENEKVEFESKNQELGKSIESCHNESENLSREISDVTSRSRDLSTKIAELRSRRDVLREMEENAHGLNRGVRRLLGKAASDDSPHTNGNEEAVAGVEGILADHIEVELQHAPAIEAALGERAQQVVVSDTNSAVNALRLLREEKSGRAAVLPLDRLSGRTEPIALNEDGVVGTAAELVRASDRMRPAIEALLDGTLVVRSIEDGLRISMNGGSGRRFVTLRGEIIEPEGSLVGGDGAGTLGVISRRSELRSVESRLEELQIDSEKLDKRREELVRMAETVEQRRRSLEQELSANRQQVAQLRSRLEMSRSQRARLVEELSVIASEMTEIDDNIGGYETEKARLKENIAALEETSRQLDAKVKSIQEEQRMHREEADRLAHEVTALRVALQHETEKRNSLQKRLAELKQSAEEYETEISTAQRQIENYRRRRVETEEAVSNERMKVAELQRRRAELEGEVNTHRNNCSQVRSEVSKHEEQLRSLRKRESDIQQSLQDLRIKEHEDRVRMDNIVERIREEYEMELSEAPEPEGEQDWEAVQEEISQLQQKLRSLGPVNLEAISEQEELEASIKFNIEQREDLEKSERALLDLINRLNKVSRERFIETFDTIRDNFREIFRKLFGGGRADIYLEGIDDIKAEVEGAAAQENAEKGAENEAEGEDQPKLKPDVLEAGIVIMASPPGKALRNIKQLSGGERTMTTIALLFAIFKTKPSPFCILDEVDAALDEANIDRFVKMVRDFLDESQFLIITHSKRTLSVADVLYGITMEEKGVSQKVAVKLNQAEELVA